MTQTASTQRRALLPAPHQASCSSKVKPRVPKASRLPGNPMSPTGVDLWRSQ
uniref:Uncharacterized protein n=1 Tax=Rhizophora mucronata TaxID=61149 RepID=A0A2P2Q9W1_RHIMU